jgi:hypothetical protein
MAVNFYFIFLPAVKVESSLQLSISAKAGGTTSLSKLPSHVQNILPRPTLPANAGKMPLPICLFGVPLASPLQSTYL